MRFPFPITKLQDTEEAHINQPTERNSSSAI